MPKPVMAPHEFSVRLQKGITRRSEPEYIFTINRGPSFSPSGNPTLQIASAIRETSTDPSTVRVDNETSRMIDELFDILKNKLKMLDGFAIVDFYGLDMGIKWSSEGFSWENSNPAGCTHGGFGALRADDNEQRWFEDAVNIILTIAGHEELKIK